MSVIFHSPPATDRPARLVVLASGGGSNFAALITACAQADYGATIVGLVVDRANTGAEQLAIDANIPAAICRVGDYRDRAAWDQALTEIVEDWQPDLVISAGFLKLCGPAFLTAFAGRYL
ncbi:MAG: formyltransferase family protein, partial [Bowdeniella nasicola]|nr:formyltransferase family protein [Bowdeniella nasicola]